MSKYKVGDHVSVVRKPEAFNEKNPYNPGFVFTISQIDNQGSHFSIMGVGVDNGYCTHCNNIEFEHIYNSPLYQALK